MNMDVLLTGLSPLEALRWFLIPATLQWFILLETVTANRRWLRWAMLLALWVPLQIVLANLLLIGGGGFFVSLLFQQGWLDFLSGTAGLMAVTLAAQWQLYARFGLLVAGWGSAWVVYNLRRRNCPACPAG